jgi:hypothetical protein
MVGTAPESHGKDAGQCCEADMKSACECFRAYARQRPEVVAVWCFFLGVIVGWKLRR